MEACEPISEERLLERIRAGEPELYGQLVARYQRHLQAVARRILNDAAEAEEAVQEAHLHVLTRLDQFRGQSSFLTYLTRVVMNEALSRIRARRNYKVVDIAAASAAMCDRVFVSHAPDPERQVIEGELGRVLRSAVAGLPEPYRVVVRLREMDRLSVAATAARLGVSCECVKTRLCRAKGLLRRRFRRAA